MQKTRILIVGSGWRSLYYVRIIKALPERFSLCAMLCRTQEKADRLAADYDIPTSISPEACAAMQPDVVVVAVNKASLAEVSLEWMARGFMVLCETPAGMDLDTLHRLWAAYQAGSRLVIAEQYTRYPIYAALLRLLADKPLGDVYCLNLSLAHEYHAVSLMRAFLGLDVREQVTITAHAYSFPTVETLTRMERITDGRVAQKKRIVAEFAFDSGKIALYDFDSEQYRSPIRRNHLKLQGVRGELYDDAIDWLDLHNQPQTARLEVASRQIVTADDNPNLHVVDEITDVSLGGRCLYLPPFGLCGLAPDETAIACMLAQTAEYAHGEAPSPYPLAEALQDAYLAMLLREAADSGRTLRSEPQPWNRP